MKFSIKLFQSYVLLQFISVYESSIKISNIGLLSAVHRIHKTFCYSHTNLLCIVHNVHFS